MSACGVAPLTVGAGVAPLTVGAGVAPLTFGCGDPPIGVPSIGYSQVVPGSFRPIAQQGWECPKCGAVMAPFVTECLHCKPPNLFPSAATEPVPSITTTTGPLPGDPHWIVLDSVERGVSDARR